MTESEAEFAVQCIKHVFERHIVLEFYITNTLEGVTLTEVKVSTTFAGPADAEKFNMVPGEYMVERLECSQNEST